MDTDSPSLEDNFYKFISDADYLHKIGDKIEAKMVVRIASMSLSDWKDGEFHPLLLCKCQPTKPLRCKNWPDGGQSWACSNWKSRTNPGCDRKHNSRTAAAIIERIANLAGRSPALKSFFDPLQVRLVNHVGFPLINHVPPFANTEKWKFQPNTFSLQKEVSHNDIKNWNEMIDLNPIPSPFEGFFPNDKEIECVRKICADLTSQGFSLLDEKTCEIPSPMTTPEYLETIKSNLDKVSEKTLLVQTVPLVTRMSQHYDYLFRVGYKNFTVKFLESWSSNNIEIFAIPLHGMGREDLEWLYGSAQYAIFLFEDKSFILDVNRLRIAITSLSQTLPLEVLELSTTSSSLVKTKEWIDEQDLKTCAEQFSAKTYESDVDCHDQTHVESLCGPQCSDQVKYEEPELKWKLVKDMTKTSLSGGRVRDSYIVFKCHAFIQYCLDNHLLMKNFGL